MKVYIVTEMTYDYSDVLLVTADKDQAIGYAMTQGKEVDFRYADEGVEHQVLRVRFKDDEYCDYIVDEYELKGYP